MNIHTMVNMISTYLNHPKLNLSFKFALNFDTIHLFEFLILVESTRSDENTKVVVCNYLKTSHMKHSYLILETHQQTF
jgi:hypothetical protein